MRKTILEEATAYYILSRVSKEEARERGVGEFLLSSFYAPSFAINEKMATPSIKEAMRLHGAGVLDVETQILIDANLIGEEDTSDVWGDVLWTGSEFILPMKGEGYNE